MSIMQEQLKQRSESGIRAEQSALKCLLDDPSLASSTMLLPEMFTATSRRAIFGAIVDLTNRGLKVDLITVANKLAGGDEMYATLEEIDQQAGVPANFVAYERLVYDAHQRDIITEVGLSLQQDPGSVEPALAKLTNLGVQSRWNSGTQEIIEKSTALLERYQNGIAGVTTGIPDLDTLIHGYVPGRLTVVAGRPAMGKTAYICTSALASLEPSAIISSEMPTDQIGLRFLSSLSTLPLTKIQKRLDDKERQLWDSAIDELRSRRIEINDKPHITIDEIATQARQWVYKYGIKVLYIDYLQRLGGDPKQDRTANIRYSISRAKEIARQLDIHVVMLSQVSRSVELRNDKRPMMADLDGAGTIEAESDAIIFLYRGNVYDPTENPRDAELIVKKNRHGMVGTLPAIFDGSTTTFRPAGKNRQRPW